MLKYRGQYRVLYEIDKTGKPCEFTFIPCRIKKGASICRQDDNTLNVYVPGIKTVNRLLKEYPDLFKPFQIGDTEGTLIFKESDIEKVAVILKCRIRGKNMSPRPKRKVAMPDERKQELADRMRKLHDNKKFIGIGIN